MTSEQFVAILGGLTALVGAIALLVRQIGELRRDLDGRLQELINSTQRAAHKEGELAGRDFVRAELKKEPLGSGEPSGLPLEK